MYQKLIRLLTGIAFVLTCGCALIVALFFYYGRGLPDYELLRHYEPPALNRLYTSQAIVLKEFATEKRLFVPLHEIPLPLIEAFLAAEDKNFYYHCGVDLLGLLRAVLINTLTKSWQRRPLGASTITQQVAKNLLIGNHRSFERKIKEAILAFRLEMALPKDRLLEVYLNQIYLGTSAYGVAAAALSYFNKDLQELTLAERATLAALPKAPSALSSSKDLQRLKERRNWVLERLARDKKINLSQAKEAAQEPLVLHSLIEKPLRADYFVQEVRQQLELLVPPETLKNGGLSVRTTLDENLQKIADRALRIGLIAYDRRHGWRGPLGCIDLPLWQEKNLTSDLWLPKLKAFPKPAGLSPWHQAVVLSIQEQSIIIGLESGQSGTIDFSNMAWARPHQPQQRVGALPRAPKDIVKIGDIIAVSLIKEGNYALEQIPDITGAIVIIQPHTGRVIALSGGYDYEISNFNVAKALRQPGSAFKPFVYLAALECGLTPDTLVLDAPLNIPLNNHRGSVYAPRNYSRRYYGPTSLQVGLEQSRNVMTVRLAQRIGMQRIERIAKKFNVVDKLPRQYAMALGAGETTLLKLTTAYAMIANGGYFIDPVFIDHLKDRYGNILHHFHAKMCEKLATEQSLKGIIGMLKGVVERGTAKRLNQFDWHLAGKTGSTNDYKDGWFIGFTADLVVGVFVGFSIPKTLGEGESGGVVAIPIFEEVIKQAYHDLPPSPLYGQTPYDLIIDE